MEEKISNGLNGLIFTTYRIGLELGSHWTMYVELMLVLGSFITFSSTPSLSAEISLYPKAGATHYLKLDQDSKGCAGKPASPQCALETWQSCTFYQLKNHCDAIGLNGMEFIEYSMPRDIPSERNSFVYAYRPMRKVIIERKDIALNSLRSDWLRVGDVEYEFSYKNCFGKKREDCDWNERGRENVFLRRQPNGNWHVLAWRDFLGDKMWENSEDNKCGAMCKLVLSDSLYADYVQNVDPDRKIGDRNFTK